MEAKKPAAGSTRSFNGIIQAADRANLAFKIGGVVAEVDVLLGGGFKAGDILARLDNTSATATLAAARAALKEGQKTLANEEREAARYETLRESGAVAETLIDQAIVRRDTARQRVERLRAEMDRAQDALSDHFLMAPFAGAVSQKMIEVADVVQGGQSVLAVTGKSTMVEAFFAVPERWSDLLELGAQANVVVKATGQQFDGQLVEIASGANHLGLIDAVIRLKEGNLTPGISVSVLLRDDNVPDGVFLPFGAYQLTPFGDGRVFVLSNDNRVEERLVTIGTLTNTGAIAIAGLDAGEVIVSKGASRLRGNEAVDPTRLDGSRFND